MTKANKYKYLNALLFQVGWFSCIYLPSLYVIIISSLILTVHLQMASNFKKEFTFVFTVGSIGYCIDSIYSISGLIALSLNSSSTIYLVCVWLLFASTLNWSMKFFMKSPIRAGLLGALAPASYFAAQSLGKLNYSEPLTHSMLIHALLWSFYMLLVHKLYFGQNSQCTHER